MSSRMDLASGVAEIVFLSFLVSFLNVFFRDRLASLAMALAWTEIRLQLMVVLVLVRALEEAPGLLVELLLVFVFVALRPSHSGRSSAREKSSGGGRTRPWAAISVGWAVLLGRAARTAAGPGVEACSGGVSELPEETTLTVSSSIGRADAKGIAESSSLSEMATTEATGTEEKSPEDSVATGKDEEEEASEWLRAAAESTKLVRLEIGETGA